MECDLTLRMAGFQTFFIPLYQRPTTIQYRNKFLTSAKSLLLSFRYKCSSCAVFQVVEPNPLDSFYCNTTQNLSNKFNDDFLKIPRKQQRKSASFVEEKLERSRNINVNLDSKESLKLYSGMLRECASKSSLKEGRAVHGKLIKNLVNLDSHLWVSLVNMYAKCPCLEYARRVLDEMPERDVISWTALIQGFVAEGNASDGLFMFWKMREEGIMPNEFTLATGLKACSLNIDLDLGIQFHAEAIKLGLLMDLFVGSALVDLYAKCREMELADSVFFNMPEKNAVSWNALLHGYAQVGDSIELLKLFSKMTESEMKLSKFTLSTVLKGCANSGNLREGQVIHSLAIKIGCELDEVLGCSLVDMYSKCGLSKDALEVFIRIKEPDVVAWSAMITCLDQQGQSHKAAKLFNLMRRKGLEPNHFSLCSLVSVATNLRDVKLGQSIHACICKYGIELKISISNALVTMYMRNGCVQDSKRVFSAMEDRDLISWNAHLALTLESETSNLGPIIFSQMLVEGFKPNMYTFISVLRSCSNFLDVCFGRQTHAQMIKNNLNDNDFVQTALIDMYAKNRSLEDADLAFNRLNNPDLFTYTVIITGHAQTDQAEKAVSYFRQMQQEGIKPNEYTFAACLSGCSCMAILETGQQIQSTAIKSGHFGDMFVNSALVHMYAKCGCIEEAEVLFKSLTVRDTVLWNTMICGYSQHGQGDKALETFLMMVNEGTMPDEVTFLGVLSACSHKGLVEEGKEHFNSMNRDFGITPKLEHFACMVDILGRAGKFDELEEFIGKMNLTPYALIWQTVLGASKMHDNVELGERAGTELFELQPERETNYILLSNIFAAKNRWDDVRKLRTLMSSRGVKKEPGCSWIQVDGQVHIFVSQDSCHPRLVEIYSKLEDLSKKLTLLGYIPKTEFVLHNITEREKRDHLQFHSERLALAFALITTCNIKTIRIFKNLRICRDCHDFMKLVSDITNREIVVRDVNRFHHFKSGTCSCQDYW